MSVKYDKDLLREVIMGLTKSCALDQHKDFVSKEILDEFKTCGDIQDKVLVAMLLRFRQCPRGIAGEVVSACGGTGDAKSE